MAISCRYRIGGGDPSAAASDADDYLRVIRANPLTRLERISRAGLADVRDKLNWTPLHFAALYGSVDAVRILLAAGADPNARAQNQATPLILAAYNLQKTRLLVEKGADVNARANDRSTPLWVALGAHGNGQTARYLVEHNADLRSLHIREADYPMRAAGRQDAATVALLLEKGLDPRRAMDTGDTALMESYQFGANRKASLLLSKGADPNSANSFGGRLKNGPIDLFGITPLMLAAMLDEPAGVSAIILAGAKPDATDHRHMTALMLAVASDRANPANIQQLIDIGADVNVADRYGETALDRAQKYRNPVIVAALLEGGSEGQGVDGGPAEAGRLQTECERGHCPGIRFACKVERDLFPGPAADALAVIISRSPAAPTRQSRPRDFPSNPD